jgi:hypothetical protein
VPTGTPASRLYPLPPRLETPEYGIQAFLWWHVDNKTAWRDADLVQGLGFGWIKQQFPGVEISGARGAYDWFRTEWVARLAAERGLKLLVRLDEPPLWTRVDTAGRLADPALFGEYCGAVAAHHAGQVAAYEVLNEPNLAREWGGQPPSPQGYADLLQACYLAVKAADPAALVIAAGLAPTDTDDPAVAYPDTAFYRDLYAAGAAPYFDLLGVHAPGYGNPPERSPADCEADPVWAARVWCFRHVEDIRAIMEQAGDGDKQMAITEMGWTSDPVNPDYSWYAVSEEVKADYLARAYAYARDHWAPWMGLMSMVYIADPDWTPELEQYWWAITRPTPPGEPAEVLPAYEALRDLGK